MKIDHVHFRIDRISIRIDIGQFRKSILRCLIGHVILIAEQLVDLDAQIFVLLQFFHAIVVGLAGFPYVFSALLLLGACQERAQVHNGARSEKVDLAFALI